MITLLYDNATQKSDLVRTGDRNIATELTLNTAVMISLFTRRRANDDDVLPEPLSNREGWWADSYPDVDGDLIGSRLWLLARAKSSQSVMNRAVVYIKEALAWMVNDGIALSVDVIVERYSDDVLAFQVQIVRPADLANKWVTFWEAHLALL